MNLKTITYYLLFFVANIGFAQELYRQNITVTNGLPSNTVYDIIQDKKGFIWVATSEGIIRYDGTHFSTFFNKNGISTAGSNVKQDLYGRIWYESFDGYLHYVENDTIYKIRQEKPLGFVNYIIKPTEIIFATQNTIETLNAKTLTPKSNRPFSNEYYDFLTSLNGDVSLFAGNSSYLTFKNNTPQIQLLSDDYFTSPIYFEANSIIYIANKTNSNPNFFKLINGKLVKAFSVFTEATIQKIFYHNNEFWICTTNGLIILDQFGKPIRHVLKKFSITSVLIDRDKTMWIGTYNDGILKIKNFNDLAINLSDLKPLRIAKDKNRILIGNEFGELHATNSSLNYLEKLPFKATNQISLINTEHPEYNLIVADGFYQTNKKLEKLHYDPAAVKSVLYLNRKEIAFAASGLVGFKKVDSLDSHEKTFGNLNYKKSFYYVLKAVRGKCVNKIPQSNQVLFGTNTGLYSFENKVIKEIKHHHKTLFIKEIHQIDNKLLCLATDGSLYQYSNNQIKFLSKTFEKVSFLKKTNNQLFLISDNRIYLWNKNTFNRLPIDVTEKILDFESDSTSYYVLLNKYLVKFNIASRNTQATTTLNLSIDKIVVNGKKHPKSNYLALKYDENNIEIGFSKIDFSIEPRTILFKINNSEWNPLPLNASTLPLVSLSPGSYNIQLKIKNHPQSLNQISLTIQKPIWLQTWFLILLSLLGLLIIILFYRRRIYVLSQKKNIEIERITLLNKVNENKLKLIKAQMNPHFFFNALNTIQSYIATNETEEATTYLDNFSKLTRMILEMTDKNTLSIEEEIKMQKLYLDLQKIRLKDFEFSIACNPSSLERVHIPTMILQPYIENAIIHGVSHKHGAKTLNITFTEIENKHLQIKIVDNGVGLKKSQEINQKNKTKSESFATKATLERLKIINRNNFKIKVTTNELFEDENSKGTEVILILKLDDESL